MDIKTDFFHAGGTMSDDSSSYIERPADDELIHALDGGELCLVLAPRQTGKSSLMIRAANRLKQTDIRSGIVDLSSIGTRNDANVWFGDVVYQIERSLQLKTNTMDWWGNHSRFGPTQRFMTFMEDVVLSEIKGRVAFFFDEIDSALELPFSDDFFTTLRALYNAKAGNPVLKRLNFVLLGVAMQSEFIKKKIRTPFNVGKKIKLGDFDKDAMSPFYDVLGPDSMLIIERIFHWTSGQPMMVQKIAQAVCLRPLEERTPDGVDAIARDQYLDARIETDTHLKFINDYLLDKNKSVRKILTTYKSLLSKKEIPFNDASDIHAWLKLSGVARVENGKLASRNRIYETIFDAAWVKSNMAKDAVKMVAFGASSALILLLFWFFLFQPLFYPTFTKFQAVSWHHEDIHYTEKSAFAHDFSLPSREIKRITLDGRDIPMPRGSDAKQGGRASITIENLPVGASRHRLIFYGGFPKESFKTELLVVYYPFENWKRLPDLEMVHLDKGCFLMGSPDDEEGRDSDEGPRHKVCLDSFFMGKTEITQGQWARIMGYNPSIFSEKSMNPVENVSWNDTQVFMQRLNQLTGKTYRLPTEAEWEYAARAGTNTPFYFGECLSTDQVNYDGDNPMPGCPKGKYRGKTVPVGSFQPNGWGLYDMHGNVWEWCQDEYGKYHEGSVTNPVGPEVAESRVRRGGSWDDHGRKVRSAYRYWGEPGGRWGGMGFRLARGHKNQGF